MTDHEIKSQVSRLIEVYGPAKTADMLGMSVDTAVRIAAGVRVRAVSLNAARYGLSLLSANPHFGESA
jgi:hypothetical protein